MRALSLTLQLELKHFADDLNLRLLYCFSADWSIIFTPRDPTMRQTYAGGLHLTVWRLTSATCGNTSAINSVYNTFRLTRDSSLCRHSGSFHSQRSTYYFRDDILCGVKLTLYMAWQSTSCPLWQGTSTDPMKYRKYFSQSLSSSAKTNKRLSCGKQIRKYL